MSDIPEEILQEIFLYLICDAYDLGILATIHRVCQTWNETSKTKILWRNIHIKLIGDPTDDDDCEQNIRNNIMKNKGLQITKKLRYSIKNGFVRLCQTILEENDVCNDHRFVYFNYLKLAVSYKNLKIVRLFLDKPEFHRGNEKEVSLIKAIQNESFEIVKCLHSYGANLNNIKYVPLYHAAKSGNLEIVQYLVNNGVNINALRQSSHMSPIYIATYHSHIKVLKFLLEKGANANERNVLSVA